MALNTTDNLRLLWLTDNYFPGHGGMAQSCDRIVYHLRRAGACVDLVHFRRGSADDTVSVKHNGSQYSCFVGENVPHDLNRIWSMWSEKWQQTQYTGVVIFGGQISMLAGPVFSAWLKTALVTLIRGNDFDSAIFTDRRFPVLERAIRYSKWVGAVTREKVEKIRSLFADMHVHYTPNGIETAQWNPTRFEREAAVSWRKTTVPEGSMVIGIFGHLKPKKGIEFFLESLLLTGAADSIHLLLIGECHQSITDWLDAHPSVHYTLLPFMERASLLSWYAACDYIALPSYYDGMPNVMLEAGALGIPLIASCTGGMLDIGDSGETGFYFTPGNRSHCSEAIGRALCASLEERTRKGTKFKEIICRDFNQEKETQRYIELFTADMH